MRHAAIYFIVLTLTSIGAQTCDAQIAWEGKLRDAHTKAKQQGKLMLLHFYTDNCVYCDRLEAGAFRSASVSQSINQNFIPVKVHGGKNPKLAKMFKVSKYPTDVIVTTDGKALSHSVSPQQPDRYIAMLTSANNGFAKSQAMLAANKQPAAAPPAPKAATPAANAPPSYAGNTGVGAPAQSVAQTKPASGFGMPSGAIANNTASTLPVQIPAPGSNTVPAAPASTASAQLGGKSRTNQFILPGAGDVANQSPAANAPRNNSAVQASLASARSEGMTLSASDLAAANAPRQSTPSSQSGSKPELAIQGYCAVSVVNGGKWVEGKPDLGVIHLGKLYLFADKASMDLFLTNPVPFTPMLNEIDVVRFFEEKQIVTGKREWGVIDPVHNRMFFFADEAAMLHFEEHFDRYLDASIEVMDQAIKESNPGV